MRKRDERAAAEARDCLEREVNRGDDVRDKILQRGDEVQLSVVYSGRTRFKLLPHLLRRRHLFVPAVRLCLHLRPAAQQLTKTIYVSSVLIITVCASVRVFGRFT